jgi:hypothetical protein
MLKTVSLDDAKWQQVLNIIGNSTGFPWAITNPLLMEIGQQLQATLEGGPNLPLSLRPNGPDVEVPGGSRPHGGPGSKRSQA